MRFYVLALLFISSNAMAQIYQYIDSHGNKVYTNQPPNGVMSRPVELHAPNTIEAINSSPVSDQSSESDTAPPYQTLEVQVPEEVLRANNGSFSVPVSIAPDLDSKHRVQLLVNGMPHGPALHAQVLEAINLPRGEHELAVQVVSGKRVLQVSPSQRLTVQRVHVNSPALRANPQSRVTP